MKKNYTSGTSSVLILVILVVLGAIAYMLFTNKADAPLPAPEEEQLEQTQVRTQTTSQKSSAVTGQTKIESTSTSEVDPLEQELSVVETEINDLMFDDLGVE